MLKRPKLIKYKAAICIFMISVFSNSFAGLMTYLDYDPSNPPPAGDLDAPTKMQALGNAIAGTNEKIAALPFNIYSAATGKDSTTGDALNTDASESEDIVNRYPGNAFRTFSYIVGTVLNPIGLVIVFIIGQVILKKAKARLKKGKRQLTLDF
jgi:hypothetical protein